MTNEKLINVSSGLVYVDRGDSLNRIWIYENT